MEKCDIVDRQEMHKIQTRSNADTKDEKEAEDDDDDSFMNRQFPNNPFSLFSGIIPGEWGVVGGYLYLYNVEKY